MCRSHRAWPVGFRASIGGALGPSVDQACALSREWLPLLDGGARRARQRGRGTLDVRAVARRLLREELGAAPGPATQALHKWLLQGDGIHHEALVREIRTVLFTDIVGSTERAATLGDRAWRELLAQHHAVIRGALERSGGREIDTAGDGFFATFDSPARAVACACEVIDGIGGLGMAIRAGVHTGECEVLEGRVSGIAVHVGARISARARPGTLLVSSTVKDLVTGSGIEFPDLGAHELRGVPGEWRLFEVHAESVPRPAVRPPH